MPRFCPICGRENVNFVEGLCEDCYRRLNPLVRELPSVDQLTFRICVGCGSVLYRGRWTRRIDVVRRHVQSLIKTRGLISSIEVGEVSLGVGEFEVPVRVCGRASDKMSSDYCEDYFVKVRLRPDVCPTCRSVIMGKEKALVQVRFVGEKHSEDDLLLLRHIVNQVLARSDEVQRGAVIDIEETENGFDIKVTNNMIARAIANAIHRTFPSRIVESHKLVGVDRSGRPVTRLTVSVHILNVKRGDVIQVNGRLTYYVLAVSRDTVHVKDLDREVNTRININELFKKRISKISVKSEYGKVVQRDGKSVVQCREGEIELNKSLPGGVKVKVVWYREKPVVIEEEILPE